MTFYSQNRSQRLLVKGWVQICFLLYSLHGNITQQQNEAKGMEKKPFFTRMFLTLFFHHQPLLNVSEMMGGCKYASNDKHKISTKNAPKKKLLELKVGVLPCHIERIQQKPKSATKVPSRINCIDRKCWAVCFTCNVKLTKTWKWEGWIQLMRKWFFTKDCVVAKSQN